MDMKQQVIKWVETKIGKVIYKDLKEVITEENSVFDEEKYVNNLLEKYFNENDISSLKHIQAESNEFLLFESDNSTGDQNSLNDSFDLESNEFNSFSAKEIIRNLENGSKEMKKISLRALEASVEDFINLTSWNRIVESLKVILNKMEDAETQNLVLKIFQKFLIHSKKLQIISKGFITTAEIISYQINIFNLASTSKPTVETFLYDKKSTGSKCLNFISKLPSNPVVIIKLMWLLIDCQQQMPFKMVGFNETKFREIIFSFIHLLHSTMASESTVLSGLELVSLLNPTASWCRIWCHTAIGRSLLCSALRKYKNLFTQIIEGILGYVKNKKNHKLPPLADSISFKRSCTKNNSEVAQQPNFTKNLNADDQTRKKKLYLKKNLHEKRSLILAPEDDNQNNPSKPELLKKQNNKSSKWIIKSIPRELVNETVFFHSICFVSYLIKFRSGRALFPVQVTTRKQLLSIYDFSLSIIDYLENTEFSIWNNDKITFTSAYQAEILEIVNVLKKVKTHVYSSRMSAEKPLLAFEANKT